MNPCASAHWSGMAGWLANPTHNTNVKQYAVKRAVQEKECPELRKAIEYMNERPKKLMSMMERKQRLM